MIFSHVSSRDAQYNKRLIGWLFVMVNVNLFAPNNDSKKLIIECKEYNIGSNYKAKEGKPKLKQAFINLPKTMPYKMYFKVMLLCKSSLVFGS